MKHCVSCVHWKKQEGPNIQWSLCYLADFHNPARNRLAIAVPGDGGGDARLKTHKTYGCPSHKGNPR